LRVESIRTYIESGILEMYALGILSQEEQREVEAMAAQHPEVKNELHAIEAAIQSYASAQAIEPSEEVRQRVMNSLITNLADDRSFTSAASHNKEAEARVIHMAVHRKTIFYKYAFAASLLLLCLSVAALAAVYRNLQLANRQLLSLQTQNEHFTQVVKYKDTELDVYRSSSFKLITLKGMPKSPLSSLVMAWSPVKKQVMVSTVHMKLPANDPKHQYQLWALVKGKPVDLGVFDAKTDTTDKGMIEMKSIAQADAFAVTLEPRGGSASPTLSEMMVMAKL
jgi:anti-sigma-K factor RskA